MKRKTMLLAAAALSVLAFTALPAIASASHVPWTSGLPANAPFSGTSSNVATLFGPVNVKCTETGGVPSITTNGIFETPDTGSVKFLFHNCREQVFNTTCTSTGQPSGTIETTTLQFHNVYLKPKAGGDTHERPGVLITPNAGHFATFSCLGGLTTAVVSGNGILGTVTNPKVGETSKSLTINVSATAEGQEHTEDHTGNKYGLEVSVNGGAKSPAYENAGSGIATLAGGAEGTTTTQT